MAEDGDVLAGRYRLVTRIATGAMGVVWRAEDDLLHRTVAVKELLVYAGMTDAQRQEAHRRAMREARIAARLHHVNAVTVFDVIEHDDRPWLIMEFVPSRSLADLLVDGQALAPGQTARLGSEIAAALAAAHEAGIVHRDVKPGNVLLAEDGTAKLTDFGIAHAVGDVTVTTTGILAGTPAFLAPEVAQGHPPLASADVFSLGATLYSVIEGVPPFGVEGNAIAVLHRVATEHVTPPRRAGELTEPLLAMLHRDPDQRPTALQVARSLAGLADDEPAIVPVPAPIPTPELVSTPAPASPPEPAPTPEPAPASEPAPTPASVPISARVYVPGPASVERARQARTRRRRAAIVIGLAAAVLLVTGTLVAMALSSNDGSGSNLAGGGTTTSPTAPAPTHAPTTSPASTQVTTPTTPRPTTKTTTTTGSSGAATGGNQPMSTILAYYAMMPGNLTTAWGWMTTDYQQNHAGGLSGYESYWKPIRAVSLSNVSQTGPANVVATIDYTYDDGHIDEERTNFTLVQQNGSWKIAASSVLSHRTIPAS